MRNIGLVACTVVLLTAMGGIASAQTLHVTSPGFAGPQSTGSVERASLNGQPAFRDVPPYRVAQNTVGTSCSLACPGFVILGVAY